MPDPASNNHSSSFVWYELHTPDAPSAAAFYQPVLGWTTSESGKTDRPYTLVHASNIPIGGLLQKPAASFTAGAGAAWIGYIGVADLHASLAKHQKLGGMVHRAAETIPDVGSFAVLADPQ